MHGRHLHGPAYAAAHDCQASACTSTARARQHRWQSCDAPSRRGGRCRAGDQAPSRSRVARAAARLVWPCRELQGRAIWAACSVLVVAPQECGQQRIPCIVVSPHQPLPILLYLLLRPQCPPCVGGHGSSISTPSGDGGPAVKGAGRGRVRRTVRLPK